MREHAGNDAVAARAGIIEDLIAAARIMAALNLVTAFGHVSARRGDRVLMTPPTALGTVTVDTLVEVPMAATMLPVGAPGETWVHLAVYQARPEVTAIARAQPEAALALGAIASAIPPLHGQGAWLGAAIPIHDDARLLRSIELARPVADTLGDADAVVLRGNGAVTTGTSPGHAAARMWLLDLTCRLRLAAGSAAVTLLSPGEVKAWREAAPPLLDRLWAYLQST